jgi:outer membrane protein OmpA-like peptidoglycan-associated protein
MRTVALSVAISALLVVGCTRERGDLAGTTATTSAVTSSSLNTPGGCSTKLPHVLEFDGATADLSPDERVELQSWASCLSHPGMDDATVVLLGPADAKDESLYPRRAEAIREELVTRGVERSRIVIGTPNAAREGGRLGPANTVMLEICGSSTLRALNEQR